MIIVTLDRLQQWLLRAGLAMSVVLLVRFAIDFYEEMPWWLAVPFCALVIIALWVSAANVFGVTKTDADYPHHWGTKRLMLLALIPLGFLASSLDCTGLSLRGCSLFCTLVKLAWIPLMAASCVVYFVTKKRGWLVAIAGMSFVPLFPHCVCYNVGNTWWIDRIGASPLCYGWGFTVSLIAVASLTKGRGVGLSLAVCLAIIVGAFGFFVSHHYFQMPW